MAGFFGVVRTTMRRWVGAGFLLCLVGALAYVSWPLLRSGFRVGGPPSPLESRWRTEEEWLVDSIVRDLAEMARFAAESRASAGEVDVTVAPSAVPGAGPVKVGVTLGPTRRLERELALTRFVWSPEEYRDLARSLLEAMGGSTSVDATIAKVEPVLATLTDLRAAVIERVNQRVSAGLARSFCDSALHEAAALLLGAFALREAAAEFADNRGALCRMTAHLAFAAALRQDSSPSIDGRVAMAVLLVLAGRGADAARALDDLDRESGGEPGLGAWRRALRLRLSDDTRTRPAHATLLERRELYGALLRTADSRAAADYAMELGQQELTDGWRLAAEVGFSVESGNVLLDDALDLELTEIREVWALARGTPLEDPGLVAALNDPATRCVTPEGPRAIGWGTWAATFQRHLVSCLSHQISHLRSMLGIHEKADRCLRDAERRFSRLKLYPFVETRGSTDARRRPARLDDLITLVIEQPELVSAAAWYGYSPLSRDEVVRRGLPDRMAWFVPMIPRGTTFDIKWRRYIELVPRDVNRLEALRATSPQDFYSVDALVKERFGDKGGVDEVEALFGERAQYDTRVLGRLTTVAEGEPAALGRVLQRRCAALAGDCFALGDHLDETGDLPGAAEAYQRGFDHGFDRVSASYVSGWLVKHYLDTGQQERARAVAEAAAATGSGPGLRTLAQFFERTGEFDRSEEILKGVLERYGGQPQYPAEREESSDGAQDEDALIGFYYRMAYQEKQAGYEKRFLELVDDDFPNGLEPADLRSFSGFPTDGVAVLKTWPYAERAGFKSGDVIVALDGYRVRNRRQYVLVRGFSDAPEMSLVVFRHPGYVEVKARSADRYLGFDMRSHKTSAARASAR